MEEPLTQKWALNCLIEDVAEGTEYHFTNTPMHVTVAGVFALEKSGAWIASELAKLLSNQPAFEIEADSEARFGLNQDTAVMKIKKSEELMNLHSKIYSWLQASGAVFNFPQYEGTGFGPHSTFQKSGRLHPGEKRLITSVSLIDLFPHGDGYQRRIVKTIPLV